MGGECKVECGWERVAARVINLTIGQVFMRAYKRDNPRVYQDGNKAFDKNIRWSISLSATTFHPSNKLMIFHKCTEKVFHHWQQINPQVSPTINIWLKSGAVTSNLFTLNKLQL
jgi:hypothetical protein